MADRSPASSSAAELIRGKDERLIVLKPFPAVLETPLALLDHPGVTPKEILFVRNNQQLVGSTTLEPLPARGWMVELGGLVSRAVRISAEELTDLEQTELELVLQCSGTGRSLFQTAAKVRGTPWGRGGVANVRFSGVRLPTVLEALGVKIDAGARFLAAEGREQPLPGEEHFEHSLPLDEALERSMLALELNGEPIPAIHGGPVRLVTPGYYATMHIKWLARLRFEREETRNYNQIPRYRVPLGRLQPGRAIVYTFDNSRPTYGMNVKSVVLQPRPDAVLPAGEVAAHGVAFNDGAAPIESVELSWDGGTVWRRADLETPSSPFAWYRWRARTRLEAGRYELWVRATDALGRSQPLDGAIRWNPSGYEWNGVERIPVTVTA